MLEKLKSFLAEDALYFAVIVVLVGIISFGLGSHTQSIKNSVENHSQNAGVVFIEASDREEASTLNQVVASKSGSKYHLVSCPGAIQIKESNKVYFDSPELAEAAGFKPAANCPGL